MKHLRRLLTSIRRKSGLRAEHPINQQPNAENEGEPPSNETERTQQSLRTIVDIPESILKEYRAYQKQTHRENRTAQYLALAAVLGAWIYAGIAALQWCQMRQATVATQRAAEAAKESADAAMAGVRPWLVNENIITIEMVDGRPEISVHYRNMGKTPARIVLWGDAIKIWNPTKPDPVFEACPDGDGGRNVFIPVDGEYINSYPLPQNTPEEKQIVSKRIPRTLFLQQCLNYKDVLSGSSSLLHHTDACIDVFAMSPCPSSPTARMN